MTKKPLLAVVALMFVGCSGNTHHDNPQNQTASHAETTISSSSSSTPEAGSASLGSYSPTSSSGSVESSRSSTATSTLAHETPLSKVQGGPQQPSSEPTLSGDITDTDKENARKATRSTMEIYVSGKEYKQWFEEISPYITPELQNTYGPKTRTEPLKSEIKGEIEVIDNDPTITPGNRYWLRTKVKTGIGEYYVKLVRTADRPNKWKVSAIQTPQEYGQEVNQKAKERK